MWSILFKTDAGVIFTKSAAANAAINSTMSAGAVLGVVNLGSMTGNAVSHLGDPESKGFIHNFWAGRLGWQANLTLAALWIADRYAGMRLQSALAKENGWLAKEGFIRAVPG